MALFKISKGASTTLPGVASSKDGYCYFTTDDGMFYIDWQKADGTLVRSPLNANNAKTLMGKSVTDNITNTAAYIPHAKAVFDALVTRDNNIEDLQNDKMNKVNPTGSGSFSMNDGRATGTNSIAFADSKNPPDDTIASGYNSFAMGLGSVASSTLSFARGEYANASGDYSVADGVSTEATATAANARGYWTKATANYAFAEGKSTTASKQSAHAEGESTTASGNYSHAEGYSTTASGDSSHAEGKSTQAKAEAAHAEGESTQAFGTGSHVEGYISQTTATGMYGHAEGFGTTVSGASGHAEGDGTTASGAYSHAEGFNSVASGEGAHAEGQETEATGADSHSQGAYTTAFGAHSFAGGNGTVAYGIHSFAHGNIVAAVGTGAHAEGYGTTRNIIISGNANSKIYTLSAVETGIQPGCLIYYNGKCAAVTAYDNNLTVTLDKTLSETTLTKVQVILYYGGFAYGQYSHSEGIRTKVFGEGSHAEGNLSEARGNYSHAEGNNTKAEGAASHAQNLYTIANGEAQTVIGKYNISDTTSAFIIGNGTSTARSNAFTIDWNGKAYFANLSTAKTNQILKAGGGNLELSTETLGSDDNPVYLKDGILTLTGSKFSDFLSLQGGNMAGHIYMTGSKPSSSTSNTSQLVFGTSTAQHVAVSSNDKTLVINPNTTSTTNQIVLYLDKASLFPSGITSSGTIQAGLFKGNIQGNGTGIWTGDVVGRADAADEANLALASVSGKYGNTNFTSLTPLECYNMTNNNSMYQILYGYIEMDDTSFYATAPDGYLLVPCETHVHKWDSGLLFVYQTIKHYSFDRVASDAVSMDQGYTEYWRVNNGTASWSSWEASAPPISSAGSATIPIYIDSEGIPTACGDTLAVSITGNAGSANSATHATTADTASYAETCGNVNFADNAGSANYADAAGQADFASSAGSADFATEAGTAGSATTATDATNATNVDIADDTTSKLFVLGATTTGKTRIYRESSVYMQNNVLFGAAWNDYAEYREIAEELKPGYCVASGDNGQVFKTFEMMQACDGIVSDTFGFVIGDTSNNQVPLAVAGRVLAYCHGDRKDYHAGDTVCAGPEGKIMKMTREQIQAYPDRIVGVVSEIPEYETWGAGNVAVDGRIWIKVR